MQVRMIKEIFDQYWGLDNTDNRYIIEEVQEDGMWVFVERSTDDPEALYESVKDTHTIDTPGTPELVTVPRFTLIRNERGQIIRATDLEQLD